MALRKAKCCLAVAAATLSMCACTAQTGNNSAATNTTNETQTAPQVSPLSEFIGLGWEERPYEENQRIDAEREARKQELISQCMHEAGFDYVVYPAPTGNAGIRSGVDYRPDDIEWVSQWGYGIIDSPFGSVAKITDLNIWQANNPNNEFLAEMSDSERAAWQTALDGTSAPDGQPVAYEELPEEHWGCTRWAQSRVSTLPPGRELLTTDEFADLYRAIQELGNNWRASTDYVELNQDWAYCMADLGYPAKSAGFTMDDPLTAQMYVLQQTKALRIDRDQGIDVSAQLPKLQELETETALDDLTCRDTTDYNNRKTAIVLAAENQFVNDYRAQLEAYRSAAEQLS